MRLTPEVMARSQTVCRGKIRCLASRYLFRRRSCPSKLLVILNVEMLILLHSSYSTSTRSKNENSTSEVSRALPAGHVYLQPYSIIKPLFPLFFIMLVSDITGLQIPLIENLASHQGTYDTINFTDNSLVSLGNIPLGE
jgi:hypothetical protein